MLRKLFRGVLDILHGNYHTTRSKLNQHIRTFDKSNQKNSLDVEAVLGFWRMVFELVCNLYLVFTLSLGIILTFSIVLLVWPFSLFIIVYNSILNHDANAERHYPPVPNWVPMTEDKPKKAAKNENN